MARSGALWSDAELNSLRQVGKAYAERQRDVALAVQGLTHHASQATRDWQSGLGAVEQFRTMAIGRVNLDAFSLPSLDALNALAYPSLGLRESAAGSVFANFEASQRKSMDALLRPFDDAQERPGRLMIADFEGSWRESMDALLRPFDDAQERLGRSMIADCEGSWRESALAFSEAIQPTETLLAGWRKGLRQNEEQLWEATELLLESPVKPSRGVGSQQALTPALPSFPANTPLRRDLGLADGIFRGSEACQGLLADSVLSRCLDDVQLFFDHGRPVSAIDRAHSALHRVLELLAEEAGMPSVRGRKVHGLFRYVRTNHPIFILHNGEVVPIDPTGELAKIIQDLTWFRNHCSLAHPTDNLPSDDVARFVVHSALVVIQLLVERHAECAAPTDRYWHRRN